MSPCEETTLTPCCRALRKFSRTTKFRRCCLEMLAWSLSGEDRDKVHDWFIALDEHHHGTITLEELKHAMVDKLHLVDEGELLEVSAGHHGRHIRRSQFGKFRQILYKN